MAPYASTNDVVMLFPQNLECWDYYGGYIGDGYMDNTSLQMQFMKRITDIILGNVGADRAEGNASGQRMEIFMEERPDGTATMTIVM